jgi:hypothetical protein
VRRMSRGPRCMPCVACRAARVCVGAAPYHREQEAERSLDRLRDAHAKPLAQHHLRPRGSDRSMRCGGGGGGVAIRGACRWQWRWQWRPTARIAPKGPHPPRRHGPASTAAQHGAWFSYNVCTARGRMTGARRSVKSWSAATPCRRVRQTMLDPAAMPACAAAGTVAASLCRCRHAALTTDCRLLARTTHDKEFDVTHGIQNTAWGVASNVQRDAWDTA